jgi:hypothetical protein
MAPTEIIILNLCRDAIFCVSDLNVLENKTKCDHPFRDAKYCVSTMKKDFDYHDNHRRYL